MMTKAKATGQASADAKQLMAKIEAELAAARESERRALADYQNLVRRTQEERVKVAQLAAANFILSIIEPLNHLDLAAEQLNDPGIKMVVQQLWQNLEQAGLEKINPLGKKFDPQTMEAVESLGDGQVVSAVIKPGYLLNGQVIQAAKVAVGDKNP